MRQQAEYFRYHCPHCKHDRNALDVAMELDPEVLRVASARRNARLQTAHAGPGRPTLASCPGCSQAMSAADLRDHRIPCVCKELKQLGAMVIRLLPKDPDPYPDFHLLRASETEVELQKGSNGDIVTIDLRKIAEITRNTADRLAYIRVLGRIAWRDDIKRWRFVPNAAVGRPSRAIGTRASVPF